MLIIVFMAHNYYHNDDRVFKIITYVNLFQRRERCTIYMFVNVNTQKG